ncbi:MAG TPA: tetratricopeptide repeat protein, partial [Tepidisphaeraceae bacterium]|nr:tetratricopeptide repeat protein [Tepidisphaeraceae bacterium]
REAIRPLQKAYDKLELARQMDLDLTVRLVGAYWQVRETGQAKSILNKVIARIPGYPPLRKTLVQFLLQDKEYAQANEQVTALEQLSPKDPEVLGYRLVLIEVAEQRLAQPAGAGADAQAIERTKGELSAKRKAVMAQLVAMPEGEPAQVQIKARLLMVGKDYASAEKLLVPLSAEELKKGAVDLQASGLLLAAYREQSKRAEAKRLVEQVLAKVPQNAQWKVFGAQLQENLSPEAQHTLSEELVEQTKDEVVRALRRYTLLLSEGGKSAEQALAVLQEAEKQWPEDGRILERIWAYGVSRKQWDLVEKYTQKLAEINWDQVQGLTFKARVKLARNDVDGALRDALEVSRQSPEFSSTWVLLGLVQQNMQDDESAITSYGKALDRQTNNPDALMGLIKCHLNLGQVARAKEYVQQGMRLEGASGAFAELGRQIDERSGDLETVKAATAAREKDLEKDRGDVERWTTLAVDYINLSRMMQKADAKGAEGYLQKASTLMGEAIKKFPDEPRPYALLANLSLLAEKPEQGLALLEQLKGNEAWKARPEPSEMLATYLERLGPDMLGKAEQAWMEALAKSQNSTSMRQKIVAFYGRSGQHEKAIGLLTAMVQEMKDAQSRQQLRQQLVDLQIAARKFAEAEKLLGEMLKESPQDASLLGKLGLLKIRQGDWKTAEEALLSARKADPEDLQARYYLGLLKIHRGELDDAVAELQAASALQPANPELRVKLAEVYSQRNQLEEAAKELESALQSKPMRKDLRVRLVQCYFQDRRWILAQRLLDEAKANPDLSDDPIWHRLESQMWMARGDLQQAYNSLLPATKLAPNDPEILMVLWDLLLKAGGYDEVIRFSDGKIRDLQADAKRRQEAGENVSSSTPWWMHMQRGMARKGQGKLDLALAEFESGLSAVDRAEDDVAGEIIVAKMSEAVGAQKTVASLAVRAKPRWKIAMARLQASQSDWANAIKTLDELLGGEYEALSPGQKLTLLRAAGPIYHAAAASVPSAAAKAEQTYNRCLKAMEDWQLDASVQLETLNNLALLLAERPDSPDPEKARIYSAKAYELMTNANAFNVGVVDTYGWVLVLGGRTDQGIELLKSAAAKESLDAWCHLGEAYAKKGDSAAAWNSFDEGNKLLAKMKEKHQPVDAAIEQKIGAGLKRWAPATPPTR